MADEVRGSLQIVALTFAVLIHASSFASADGTSDARAGLAAAARGDSKQAIELFTTALASSNLSQANRTVVFYNRGVIYERQSKNDLAIADYTSAIRIDPHYVDALNRRGVTYEDAGLIIEALKDYDTVISIRPTYDRAYNNRGILYSYQGRYEQALADFDNAIRLNPNSAASYVRRGVVRFVLGKLTMAADDFQRAQSLPYPNLANLDLGGQLALWLHVTRVRMGSKSTEEFARSVSKIDLAKWPGPLIKLYLGHATVDEVVIATKEGDEDMIKIKVCMTNFFVGEWQAMRKDPGAAAWFERAKATCVHQLPEYVGAQRELGGGITQNR